MGILFLILSQTFISLLFSAEAYQYQCQEWQTLCGDLCSDLWVTCKCGQEVLNNADNPKTEYCCLPQQGSPGTTQQCHYDTKGDKFSDVTCEDGTVINTTQQCSGKCYNDYEDSQFLGKYAHYTCPGGTCLPLLDMCQGYSCSNTNVSECGRELRCINNAGIAKLSSKIAGDHYYCYYSGYKNDGVYHRLDRSDEDILGAKESISFTGELQSCEKNTGVTCGKDCIFNYRFCQGDAGGKFDCVIGNRTVNNEDEKFCSNPTLWRNISCEVYTAAGGYVLEDKAAPLRCRGQNQHCIRPWYSKRDGAPVDGYRQNCLDKSDQVFHMNTKCNVSSYIDIHKRLFCDLADVKDELVCSDPETWLQSQSQHYQDPHLCQASCATPGPGCLACTNPDYFMCEKSGVCLHPQLECDGHPQCPGAEDEDLGRCLQKYRETKVVSEYATKECYSAAYPLMKTLVTVCDGVPECVDDEDEADCAGSSIQYILMAATSLGCLALYVILAMKYGTKVADVSHHMRANLGSKDVDEELIVASIENYLGSKQHVDKLSLMLLRFLYTKPRAELNKTAVNIYDKLAKAFNFDEPAIHYWIFKNLDSKVCDIILNAKFPGFTEKYIFRSNLMKELRDTMNLDEGFRRKLYHLKIIIGLQFSYMDIYKDCFLAMSMMSLIGGPLAVIKYYTTFTSAVVICLFSTIFVPLLISGLGLAINAPNIIYNYFGQELPLWKRCLMRLGNVVFSIATPILLKHTYEYNKEKLRRFAKNGDDTALNLLKRCKTIKGQVVEYLKHELNLENVYQVSAQILLILMARTNTPTTGGLKTFFDQDSFWGVPMPVSVALTLSVVWSMKTVVRLHVRSISVDKEYFGTTASLFVAFQGLIVATKRIITIVAFFIPSLGLCNLLHHWQAEQLTFHSRLNRVSSDEEIRLRDMTERVYWSQLDRWNYSDPSNPQPPNYDIYTGLTLKWTFASYFIVGALQCVLLFIVKMFFSKGFRKDNLFNKFVHILENTNIASPFADWDKEPEERQNLRGVQDNSLHQMLQKSGLQDFRERLRLVEREMMMCFAVNALTSVIMLIPLWHTAYNIVMRHQFLGRLIPVKAEECTSYHTAVYLAVLLSAATLVFSALEVILYKVYNRKIHPWSVVVKKEKQMSQDSKWKGLFHCCGE